MASHQETAADAKRRPLRKIIILSAAIGLLTNSITIAESVGLRWHSEVILDAWVFVVVSRAFQDIHPLDRKATYLRILIAGGISCVGSLGRLFLQGRF